MNTSESANSAAFPEEKEIHDLLVQLFNPSVQKIGEDLSGRIKKLAQPMENIKQVFADISGLEEGVKDLPGKLKKDIAAILNGHSADISAKCETIVTSVALCSREISENIDSFKVDVSSNFAQAKNKNQDDHQRDKEAICDQIENRALYLSKTINELYETSIISICDEIKSVKLDLSGSVAGIIMELNNAVAVRNSDARTFRLVLIVMTLLQIITLVTVFLR